jgi:trk system potassium uptake protein TrkH
VAAALSLAPVGVALLAGELALLAPLLASVFALGLLSLLLRRVPAVRDLQINEALVIVVSTFIIASLAGSLAMAGMGIGWLDAVFEATSAVTTTGLSTLASVEGRSKAFLFTRAWMQWYGGLGVAVLSVALVLGPGMAARRLEGGRAHSEDSLVGARAHARIVLAVYVAMTAVFVLLIWLAGAAPFDALLYGLAAVSTGGFAPHDQSLAAFDGWLVPTTVILACLAGSVTLTLYHRAARSGLRVLVADVELRTLLLLAAAGTLCVGLLGLWHGSASEPTSWVRLPLLVLSAQTTAGFAPLPVTGLDDASKLVLIAAMGIGGSTGSTAGGIKLLRLLVVAQVVRWALARIHLPSRAVSGPRLGGEPLADEEIRRAVAVIGLFGVAAAASWLIFLAHGHPALDSLFEVASALGTVGLSTGLCSPDLAASLKALLCIDMLLGRVEVLALLVAVWPRTWLGRRRDLH